MSSEYDSPQEPSEHGNVGYPPPSQPPPTQPLPYSPAYGGQHVDPGYGSPEPTADERNWAVAAHLGSLLSAWFALGLFAPLLVLLLKGGTSEYIRRQATESLNFQINAFVWTAILAISMLFLVGFVLLPLYGVFYLIQVILAAVRASQGQDFRYALTVRVIS